MKWLVWRTFRRMGIDIRPSYQSPSLIDFLRSRQVDLVLDVGANVGQFGQSVLNIGYRGQIVSFEPIAEVFERLSANIAAHPNWTARNFALGNTEGQAEISVSQNTVFSSLRPQTELAADFDASSRTLRKEMIAIKRLDDIFAEFRSRNILLKIDTQGFEKDVLLGAAQSLGAILGVQLEIPIGQLYQQSWDMQQALAFMAERGFVLCQTSVVNTMPEDRAAALELDCVFRRA